MDWNNPTHPLARREPRRGERAVLRATVTTPQVRTQVQPCYTASCKGYRMHAGQPLWICCLNASQAGRWLPLGVGVPVRLPRLPSRACCLADRVPW